MSQRVAVLGGGISGLAAAWNLARRGGGVQVSVFEAGEEVGGWLRSERTEQGAVMELGPRSLRIAGASGKTTLSLMDHLGLANEVVPVPPTHKGAKRRLIYTNKDGLVEVPSGLSWLFRTKPPFTRPLLPAVLKEPFQKKRVDSSSENEDESVYSFITRRLGKELADYLIDPMCRGIYAGSAHSLSMKSCFQLFHNYEKTHGSLIKGAFLTKTPPLPEDAPGLVRRAVKERWQIYTLRPGLQSLSETLHRTLAERGVEVFTQEPVERLSFSGSSAEVETAGGEVQEVDHVISALPSHVLARLLPQDHSPMCEQLMSIPSVSVGVVCLEFTGNPIPAEYRESFGYLVPSHQEARVLGVVFDSATFPQHDRQDTPSTRMTVMLGGEWFEQLFGDPDTVSDDVITQAALEDLEEHLGITQLPFHAITRIHKNCIPQYTLGHSKRLDSITRHISDHRLPLTLVGASYSGVSVNDCIHNAIQATDILGQT